MKCELCHQKDAETALVLQRNGADEELYVCRECANKERVRRQKKSQRTRKVTGLPPGMSMSITQIGGDGDAPPPMLEAIMNAMSDFVSGIERKAAPQQPSVPEAPEKEPKFQTFPCARADAAYRIGKRLHLEGLHLIGELESVERALRALDMKLVGVEADGIKNTGHVFSVAYADSFERAKRVVKDVLDQERNARVRLLEEMPRVLGDSICRALAVLKNCRLVSPGELFDLLSPLKLAALEGMLDGITLDELTEMLVALNLNSNEDKVSADERDRIDADRADKINKRFEDVVLNERAEEKFL